MTPRPDPVRPPQLRRGDRIRVVAPASAVDARAVERGAQDLRAAGYDVVIGRRVMGRFDYFSASDGERAADFNDAIYDPDARVILAARGGYGATRILPWIDWDAWRRHPRAFLGYSDCTAILAGLARAGLVGFHGPVLESGGWAEASGAWCLPWLEGAVGPLHPDPLVQLSGVSGEGFSGILAGGNLTLLSHLVGTRWEWPWDMHTLLVLEEVGEAPYRIDRMLTGLEAAGVWERVGAVVVGRLSRCDAADGRGPTAEDVVVERLSRLRIPVYSALPSGHGGFQVTLPMGARVVLRHGRLWLPEPAVTV